MCLYHQHILTFIIAAISWTSAEFQRDLEMGCYTINSFKHIRLLLSKTMSRKFSFKEMKC